MPKLVEPLQESLFGSDVADVVVDVCEVGIDSILDAPFLEEIPILKVISSVARTVHAVRERSLLRQTYYFLEAFNKKELEPEALEEHRKKLESDPAFAEKELGRVLVILDLTIDKEKSVLLGRIYAAYVRREIDWDRFCELSDVVSRVFVADLALLKDIERGVVDTTTRPVQHQVERLVGLGLVEASMKSLSFYAGRPFTEQFVNTSSLGKLFCKFA